MDFLFSQHISNLNLKVKNQSRSWWSFLNEIRKKKKKTIDTELVIISIQRDIINLIFTIVMIIVSYFGITLSHTPKNMASIAFLLHVQQ